MASSGKDTIYIDIDDEITSIIDKVRSSKQKIVALVLPKRAAVLQSVVNMKLLKKSAEDSKKSIVLITSESALLPLAGAVGLHVAKTLQSKPAIPPRPDLSQAPETLVDDEKIGEEPEIDANKSIGELAGISAVAPTEETIDVDNTEPEKTAEKSKKDKNKSKDKKPKIPNFESFRMRLFLGILALIVLIVAWVFAFMVLPKAKITAKTDTSTVNSSPTFTADTAATQVDTTKNVTPATLKQLPKTDSQQVAATGQKDNGTKASGSVTLSLKDCSQSQVTIPAGSGVSTNGLTYITQQSVSLSSVVVGGVCKNSSFPSISSGTTAVISQQNGDKYNIASGQSFTVAGFSNVSGSNGSAMTGGTSQIVKVIAQADIDSAKQQILDKDRDGAKSDLNKQFQSGNAQPILETFSSGNPTITSSANVGDQADNVTVTAKITYTMLGVKKDDLQKIIEADVKKQIDTNKQPIQDYGFNNISFQVLDGTSTDHAKVTLQTEVIAGVKLNLDDLKRQVAGKKKGDVQQIIGSQTGVKEVTVSYSPFWVSQTPKKTSKITIVLQQANSNAK